MLRFLVLCNLAVLLQLALAEDSIEDSLGESKRSKILHRFQTVPKRIFRNGGGLGNGICPPGFWCKRRTGQEIQEKRYHVNDQSGHRVNGQTGLQVNGQNGHRVNGRTGHGVNERFNYIKTGPTAYRVNVRSNYQRNGPFSYRLKGRWP